MQDNQSTSWSHDLKFIQFMRNRALHSGRKRTPYKALFACAPRVELSTTPISREVFDAVEDKQQFENAFKVLTACFQRKDDAVFFSTKHH
ncbi:uncharacterized protein TNCV_4567801 [Trichonephila clavipes]|nr:uncharacterized protein TNCV_4567801 [Trichonephila clavipes]